MIRVESATLEQAYKDAASKLECSASELIIEVVQSPSKGFLGLFKKNAIIVAVNKKQNSQKVDTVLEQKPKQETIKEVKQEIKKEPKQENKKDKIKTNRITSKPEQKFLNDTIMPETFVSTQDDEDYNMDDINFMADYEDDESAQELAKHTVNAKDVARNIEKEINALFDLTCFKIEKIDVSAYDENTLLVEFKGEDAALLIGKEGYRYKALSYMIFNWINTKYQLQLRLEIAEFLKNQEESVARYLVGVYETVERDGRAQTKILDGVLVQIALKELRERYPNKYVAIRSTRDGLKFIIINDYHN